MPSEGRSNTRLPQSNASYYPIFESVIPLGVHMAIRTQWYRQMARRIRARRVLGINPRTDFLTVEEETVEPLPLYTKVPSAGEITVEISTLEKLPDYHDAVPTDDVVAGRKRKRRTRFDGRCRWSAKRRRTEIVEENERSSLQTSHQQPTSLASPTRRGYPRDDLPSSRSNLPHPTRPHRRRNPEEVDIPPLYTKLPGAGETTVDISPSEQEEMLPEYSEAGRGEDEGKSEG
ncbi:hypothetical protein NEUTE1DRAFT_41032 [Neurospora tetrasperma FGSC 2508]|uniref:Uncharacterized protein n=1 Tax=Neurospora tetrasperma (strain FGSC 2508 / ATCC MYA-4615 / P0657) TaxID=510951 RepID=F8ML23_NEUT8|nr:uncharacterized protein NEUTE1DRAFT_41032 [Neurospora tetrasperma FGSC 2508]EGO58348.1 hypothetical protein NEUTE1DRAFT_41032 [Neurospora tetrasperma FGSC 2508]EGZ71328.1 hypothetical protein NEUTE2DRAFT_64794 [Neurospora tetrasperma FGSC 2509]